MLDTTAFEAALKTVYSKEHVEDMVYRTNPLLSILPKDKTFYGKTKEIGIVYGDPQGRSKTFANAKARAALTESSVEAFSLTRKKDYSIAQIEAEVIEASKNDEGALLSAAEREFDGAIRALNNSLGISVFTGTDSALAQVSAEPTENASTFQITLKDPNDIVKFARKQMIVMYAAKTGGSAKTSDGTDDEWEIAAVNKSTGVLTLTGTYDSSGDIAANDYIFIEGDRGQSMSGLEDWIPSSTPGSTAFYGVDRSVDPTGLGGQRLDGTSAPIEEVLIEADSIVHREGFALDHFVMNNKKLAELKKSLGTRVQIVTMQANPRISFQGVIVEGMNGPIKCFADRNCPTNRIYGLQLDMWTLYSLGELVRCADEDGSKMLRLNDSDGYEARWRSWSNLACKAPGSSINIQV